MTTTDITFALLTAAAVGDKCAVNGSGGGGGGGGGGDTVAADTGIVITGTSPKLIGTDPAITPNKIEGSASWDPGSVAQSACPTTTFTLTGAALGDRIAFGRPATLAAGFHVEMWVSAANTITLQLCKITSGSVSPGNLTYNAMVLR